MKIKKASGIVEEFNENKLRASLLRSGADNDQVREVLAAIEHELVPYASTKKIYRLAKKYLRQINHASGIRYTLKRALFRLGPSGYPFEKYVGVIFEQYGYKVRTGIILEGKCVNHEVDVFALKDDEISIVECKYHNRAGSATDVKVAMYIHSRFRDLTHTMESQYPGRKQKGWLFTNTRCTTDAIKYAKCSGFNIKGWSHPDNGNLQEMIEEKKLYPVTIISGVKKGLIKTLFNHNIILLKDLADMDLDKIKSILALSDSKALLLKRQADELCCF